MSVSSIQSSSRTAEGRAGIAKTSESDPGSPASQEAALGLAGGKTHGSGMTASGAKGSFRLFRRGPWENLATLVIAAGVIMLMQPFSIELYGWSFLTTLVGTAMFIIVSKFPD
jgi:hypothetical protein